MSWIVEEIIRRSYTIRSNIVSTTVFGDESLWEDGLPDRIETYDFNNDEYLDLLVVENAISSLLKKGKIRKIEHNIIKDIKKGLTYYDISRRRHLSTNTVKKIYKKVCARIAFYLGDKFTTEGFTEYFIDKHNLEEEQIEKLKGVIS